MKMGQKKITLKKPSLIRIKAIRYSSGTSIMSAWKFLLSPIRQEKQLFAQLRFCSVLHR